MVISFLGLNGLSLDTWLKKMSYWGNCGDALSIYAMCDLYGVHCCVMTRTKPWDHSSKYVQRNSYECSKNMSGKADLLR